MTSVAINLNSRWEMFILAPRTIKLHQIGWPNCKEHAMRHQLSIRLAVPGRDRRVLPPSIANRHNPAPLDEECHDAAGLRHRDVLGDLAKPRADLRQRDDRAAPATG